MFQNSNMGEEGDDTTVAHRRAHGAHPAAVIRAAFGRVRWRHESNSSRRRALGNDAEKLGVHRSWGQGIIVMQRTSYRDETLEAGESEAVAHAKLHLVRRPDVSTVVLLRPGIESEYPL